MDQQIKAALESGNLSDIMIGWEPDESYRCRYEPMCPFGHDHSDRAVTMDVFRWGASMWMLTGDGNIQQVTTDDAKSKAARMVEAFRSLASLQEAATGTDGNLTVEHTVNGEVSLVDTPFEDMVIPTGLSHGWDTV